VRLRPELVLARAPFDDARLLDLRLLVFRGPLVLREAFFVLAMLHPFFLGDGASIERVTRDKLG